MEHKMVRDNLDYMTEEECIRKGFDRTESGKPYKRRTLERYEIKGYLDGGKYESHVLSYAGWKLWKDWYLGKISNVSANDVSKVRVDGGGSQEISETVSFARRRYDDACRCLPYEFKDIVVNVCCWEMDIIGDLEDDSKRQRQYKKTILLELLKMGLARLVEHYRD